MIRAIQRRMAARRNGETQGGFTLIELMVVVMIIAILIGIAIPAFLGARKRAQDTGAKSNLRNALSSATAIFSDEQTYPASTDMVTALTAEEPSLKFVDNDDPSPDSKTISVITGPSVTGGTSVDMVILAAKSKSGKCFFLRHVNTPDPDPTDTVDVAGTFQAESTGTCTADAGAALDATAWSETP